MVIRSAGESDLERSTDRITRLYRSLAAAIVSAETFSSVDGGEGRQAEEFVAKMRELCVELERLWAVAEEGDDASRATVPRRIGVLEREIQTLLGKVQSLAGSRIDRVDTGWKR